LPKAENASNSMNEVTLYRADQQYTPEAIINKINKTA